MLPVPGLIERSAETSAVDAALAAAEKGVGQSLLLSGQAGVGKSSLLSYACDAARALGFTVLQSCPTPVSTGLAHRVVRDWVGPLARQSQHGDKPFDGPAAGLAEALVDPRLDHQAWSLTSLDYALSWVLENLTEHTPLLLAVDDVQWADGGSLQVLDLLSARLPCCPVVLVMARRTGEATVRSDIVDRISSRATLLTPLPLSVTGVETMRRAVTTAPGMAEVSSSEVHRLTGGVPFLVRELLRSGRGPSGSAPASVVDSVRERLGRLGDPAVEIARTVALLGDEATFDALADLCGLTVAELADPLETLTDSDIVTVGMWRAWTSHPLVSEAILAPLTPSERSDRHRLAAEYLGKLDRPAQVVASHLVHTLPDEDATVVALLRAAAEESLESGVPQVAATQLLRAVGETRPEATDPGLLTLAATAHMRAGLIAEAFDLWRRALDRMQSAEDRAVCLADMGDAQMTLGLRDAARASYQKAAGLLAEAGHDSSSQVVRFLLARMGMAQALFDGAHGVMRDALADAADQPVSEDTHSDRLLFALAASALAFEGRDSGMARMLALRALGDGRLLEEETCDGKGYYIVTGVLAWTDSFTENLAAVDAAVEDSHRRGSAMGFATASFCRGFAHLRRGGLREAVTDLDAALAMRSRGWKEYVETATAGLAFAHVGLGHHEEALALEPELRELAKADELLSALPRMAAGLVRATHGDHQQALLDYRAAARLLEPHATNPALGEWRELAAWSLGALGRRAEAQVLAAEAVAQAREWGAPRTMGFALRTLGNLVAPAEGITHLREAMRLFESCEAGFYLARVRLDLGTLLVGSASTRAEGMELLQQALEQGREADLPPIVRRAARVLVQHGIRVAEPVDSPLSQLTSGERRVVELAATGRTNRRIAQELFVTVKAVEWHLSNAYRKLGISSRAQLPDVMSGAAGSSSSSAM